MCYEDFFESDNCDYAYLDQEYYLYLKWLEWEDEQAWLADMEEKIAADEQYELLFGHLDEEPEKQTDAD